MLKNKNLLEAVGDEFFSDDDIKIGLIFKSKDGRKKYKIIDVSGETVTYKPMVFGVDETKQIKLDILLNNFKKMDE